MITFIYNARNALSGESVKAEVQAETEQSAARLLISQDLVPISIVPKDRPNPLLGSLGRRVRTKDKVLFTRQLATLINAGLPLVESLRTVREQINSKALLSVINQVISDVEGGSTLADAFGKHPKIFNQIYISLIRAGEVSGSLDESLQRIANQAESDAALVSKIRGAMVYPVIVLVIITLVVIFMLTTVLPQVEQLYADLGEELPFITSALLAVAGFIAKFWYLLTILIGGGTFFLIHYVKTAPGRRQADRLKLTIPFVKTLFQKLYMARFCRTSGVLLASGLPMLEMLRIVEGAMNNVHLAEAIERAANKVKGGKALSTALAVEPHFLVLVPQMLRIGEQSGAIDAMLDKTATFYEEELDNAIKNLSTTIEPALIVFLGVTVGVIVAAILLPVYGLINLEGVGT